VRPEDLGEHLRIRVIAGQADGAHAENPGRLDRHRREHDLRLGALRHQRRDPPQRGLLLGQVAQLVQGPGGLS